jgi:iron complex transport system ATP-binding protein
VNLVELEDVGVFVPGPGGTRIQLLEHIDWTVASGEHWALLGPNGAGKTTLVSIVSTSRHPSSGRAAIFGGWLGSVDLRALRPAIGVVDDRRRTPVHLDALSVVVTGISGDIQLRPEHSGAVEQKRARELLELVGCTSHAAQAFGTLSQGEQARVRIARALAGEPRLLVLDEPATGLDLPGREDLVAAIRAVATEHPELATVTIAHYLEELGDVVTNALLLRGGRVVAGGRAEQVLTAGPLSECFGRPLDVERRGGRYFARAASATARSAMRREPR